MKNSIPSESLNFDPDQAETLWEKSFDHWFSVLMGNRPFKWQWRLFLRFMRNDIPSALDIPTGLGKTSVMTIWLLARAWRPSLPRRLVYVVDRRVVVDQATAIAEQLQKRILNNPECALLAEKLRLDQKTPLPISTLRGQLADNRQWLEDPTSTAIVIGTVDMIGSRLLFSGYRGSRWSRPVHAALLGVDSLVVLDEAHLVPAFYRILKYIESQRQNENPPIIIPPLHILPLSATSQPSEGTGMFRLEEEDRKEKRVSERIGAIKCLKFIDIDSKLSDELSKRALAHDGKPHTVVVFCNGRADAQEAAESLRRKLGKDRNQDVRLLTGAQRGFERDQLALSETFRAFQHEYPKDGRTRFLVCTAAGEVGADLDGQHAVMDLVTLERMIQRLGRVNRRGEFPGGSNIEVLINRAQLETRFNSNGLSGREISHLRKLVSLLTKAEHVYDASPGAMEAMLKRLSTRARKLLCTPDPPSPPLERAHVEAWSMTSLADHPGRSEVAPFLRGIVDETPQTEVTWRADISLLARLAPTKLIQALEVAPVRPSEILVEEDRSVAEKLIGRVEHFTTEAKKSNTSASQAMSIIITRGDKLIEVLKITRNGLKRERGLPFPVDRKKLKEDLTEMLSNGTVWLPCAFGGLDDDGLFANDADGAAEPPRDYFSLLRLIVSLSARTATPLAQEWPDGLKQDNNWEEQLRKKHWRRVFMATLPNEDAADDEDPTERLEYWAPRRASFMDGATGEAPKAQSLKEHHRWTEAEAAYLADALQLPEWLKNALRLAGRHHDSGKGRELWQHAMRADREPASLERPLAKTTNRGGGDLGGYRHEFGSIMDAFEHGELVSLQEVHRELVLHLIAAHHGRARPYIPGIDPDIIVPTALEENALDVAKCFARLQRMWGPWGLAWLETLLRAADVKASRMLEERPA